VKRFDCEFESEVLAAVLESRWPEQAESPLRAHAASCPICSEVANVSSAVNEARIETRAAAVVPEAGRMWWMAQLRARREAAEAAGRPITAAQVLAFACSMGLLGACFGATSAWFQAALRQFASIVAGFRVGQVLPALGAVVAQHGIVAIAAAALLFLFPAALLITVFRR
jgi:hypothetical protein